MEDEELEQEQVPEQEENPIAAARSRNAARKNMQADRTTNALDNAARIAKFTPAAGYAKAYQVARGIDNKLTGGKISRGLSKAVNASNPSLKALGALGGSKLANNTIGAASKLKGGSGGSSTDKSSSNKSSEKTGASISGNKNAKSSSNSKDLDKKKKKSNNASSISDKSDEKKEKTGLQSSALEVFLGEMTPMKIVLLAIGAFVGFVLYFFVVIFSAVEDKKQELKAQAFSAAAGSLSTLYFGGTGAIETAKLGYTIGSIIKIKYPIKIGNVSKKDDNSYKRSAYDFIEYKEEYVAPEGDEGSDTRDNSKRNEYLKKIREEFPDDIANDYYEIGTEFTDTECYGDDCDNTAEVRFYQKIADIAYRYKTIYNVELDWPLIMAAVSIKDTDKEKLFNQNLTDYTVRQVSNLKKVMSLDWEYDYTNIDDYEYLSPDDARYDLQLLAKNMVKKKTVQTCTNTKDKKIVKQTELEDIEDALIDKKLDNGYYLKCDKGTEYAVKSTYEIDKDKFDEFLDEYIEKRYYLQKGNSSKSSSPTSPDGGPGPSTTQGTADFGWPLPAGVGGISSHYGPRGSGYHYGVDFGVAVGTPVYAIADGVVEGAASNCTALPYNSGCGGGYGNNVRINHGRDSNGNVVYAIYAHGSTVVVKKGDTVKRGQLIMYSGNTGHVIPNPTEKCPNCGQHLHFEIKLNNGTCSKCGVNPSSYIGVS